MRVRQEVLLEWTLTFFQSGRRASLAKELWYPYWTMVSHKLMTSLHSYVAKCKLEFELTICWSGAFQGSHALWGPMQCSAWPMCFTCQQCKNMQFALSAIHACNMLFLPRHPSFVGNSKYL